MSYAIVVVRLAILAFCLYGYIGWISERLRPEFSPAVLFAGIGAAMFIAGILNIMRLAVVGILAVGAVLAVRRIIKLRSAPPLGIICGGSFAPRWFSSREG